MESIDILGVRVDSATYDSLLARVDEFIASRAPHQVVTLNPEMLVAAHDDPDLCQALNQADLNVADGVGLLLAARILGHRLPGRVTGSDGIYHLAAHSASRGYRPFFLGAAPGVAERVARRLAAAYPALQVAGTFSGSPAPADEPDILAAISAARPDILLVAYGVPAEEMWIARHRARLAVPVMIGVGGAFDFVAGITRRAPAWMRRLGVEWLHRLLSQPWRWRRQLALPRFILLVLGQRFRKVATPAGRREG